MNQGIRPFVTTGIALVGAGAIAVAPISLPPAEVHAPSQPVAHRVVTTSDVQMATLSDDLVAVIDELIDAPGRSVEDLTDRLRLIPTYIDILRSREPADAVAAFTAIVGTFYSTPITPFVQALKANLPNQAFEYEFADALRAIAVEALEALIYAPLAPLNDIGAIASGQDPVDVLRETVAGYLELPAFWADLLAYGIQNSAPPPIGGNPTEPGEALILDIVRPITRVYIQLIQRYVAPDNVFATGGVAKSVASEWPPDAETVGETVRGVLAEAADLPGDIVEDVVRNARIAGEYLVRGRPLDAVRFLVSRALEEPIGWAEDFVYAGTVLAPPPFDGVIERTFEGTSRVAGHLSEWVAPEPLKIPLQHRQIGPGGPVDLKLPTGNKVLQDGGNLIVSQGVDNKDGATVTKTDTNRPKVGSNVRAVVKEMRNDVRETVKEVRQGVRDVVKAVTGLGKKKEAEKPPPAAEN